jgi:hypothetical protein
MNVALAYEFIVELIAAFAIPYRSEDYRYTAAVQNTNPVNH